MTALKDLVINVPIQDDAINNTIIQLPRTLNEAGLIGIELKRKKEMKNTHSPVKIFKWITKLKESNNPYYLNVNSLEDFEKKCKEKDTISHDLIFGHSDDLEEEVAAIDIRPMIEVVDELTSNEDEEEDLAENDDLFAYDKSVCMAHKYPEITVAPGEGQTPKGILSELDWDVRAFPHLHNPDGSNGKDQARKIKLTDHGGNHAEIQEG